MNRYQEPVGAEYELELGSRGRVLGNLLGVRSKTEMDYIELESLIEAQHSFYLKDGLENETVTASFIREMHRVWLKEIYSWAGEYRSMELSKDGFV